MKPEREWFPDFPVITTRVYKTTKTGSYRSSAHPSSKKAECTIERDFYWLLVIAPDRVEIKMKYSGQYSAIISAIIDDNGKITYYGAGDDVSNLPESLTSDVERVFHARAMY